jgi:hypothetical protein
MQLPKKEESLSRFSPIPVVLLKTISLLLLLRVSMKFIYFSCKRISQGEASNKAHQLLRSLILTLSSVQWREGGGGKFTLEFLLLQSLLLKWVVPSPNSFLTLLSFPYLGPYSSSSHYIQQRTLPHSHIPVN